MSRALCLNCIDGRVQLPVIQWIKDNYRVGYVDMITEPGMDGFLADPDSSISDIIRKVQISVEKNQASIAFIAGHHDCKGNPVDEATHRQHVFSAVERLNKEFSDLQIVGVWINAQWNVESLE